MRKLAITLLVGSALAFQSSVNLSADKTKLKKKKSARVTVNFNGQKSVNWNLACEGVSIQSWTSTAPIEIAHKDAEGFITSVGAKDYPGKESPQIDVRPMKGATSASCTLKTEGAAAATAKVDFTIK